MSKEKNPIRVIELLGKIKGGNEMEEYNPDKYPENIQFILDTNEELWKVIEARLHEKISEYFNKFGMEQKDLWLWSVAGLKYDVHMPILVNQVCRDMLIEEQSKWNK